MQGQYPTQTIVSYKGHDSFIEEALQDTQFESDTQKATRNKRLVLGKVVGTHDTGGSVLEKSIQTVAGAANGLEILGSEI